MSHLAANVAIIICLAMLATVGFVAPYVAHRRARRHAAGPTPLWPHQARTVRVLPPGPYDRERER